MHFSVWLTIFIMSQCHLKRNLWSGFVITSGVSSSVDVIIENKIIIKVNNPGLWWGCRDMWALGTGCVGLVTFLSDHRPANSNTTLARGAGPLWSHQPHICCFNNNKHTKKFVIIDQFDVKWRCWEALQHWIWDLGLVLNRHRILNLVILVTSSSSPVLVVWSE